MSGHHFDAIILGGGAAGLTAGIFAAERGRRVMVLEKGKKAGVKILMSGGTRCNITHDCDARGVVAAFGPNGKFLHSALAGFTPRQVVEFFHAEGVATKVEETGKVFPVSDRALDVLHALLRRLERGGATLALSEPALDVDALPAGGFGVSTPRRQLTCETLLVTTGGLSYPGCGNHRRRVRLRPQVRPHRHPHPPGPGAAHHQARLGARPERHHPAARRAAGAGRRAEAADLPRRVRCCSPTSG